MKELFKQLAQRVVDEAFSIVAGDDEYACSACFNALLWRGKGPINSDSVLVSLPLGDSDMESPEWEFSLRDLVTDAISFVERGSEGPIAGRDRQPLQAIAELFREQADRIDEALRRGATDAPEK